MATVHLAHATDSRDGPPLVAIKRPRRHLASDKRFVTMLVDEARLASAITDPRVVKVRELGFEGGLPFIVMDYVEGASLAELRRELSALGRAIDVRVGVRIALDMLGGLHAAHELRDDNARPSTSSTATCRLTTFSSGVTVARTLRTSGSRRPKIACRPPALTK